MRVSAFPKSKRSASKQNVVENSIGEKLIFDKEPAQIDFPNVVITIPKMMRKKWYKVAKSSWSRARAIDE